MVHFSLAEGKGATDRITKADNWVRIFRITERKTNTVLCKRISGYRHLLSANQLTNQQQTHYSTLTYTCITALRLFITFILSPRQYYIYLEILSFILMQQQQ